MLTTQLQAADLDVTQFVSFWQVAMMKLELIKSSDSIALRKFIMIREKPIFTNKLIQAAMYLDKRFGVLLKTNQIIEAKNFIKMVYKKKKTILLVLVSMSLILFKMNYLNYQQICKI